MSADLQIHPLERAGLGKAPFRFVGTFVSKHQACPGATVKAGASCDYCANSIALVCRVRSSDGREFKLGCDCVAKVDAKLAKLADKARREHERSLTRARNERDAEALSALLADDAVRDVLSTLPSPTGRSSMLDWSDFCSAKAGAAGRKRALKAVREAVGR